MGEDLLDLLTFFSRIFAEQITKYSYEDLYLGKDAFIIDYIGKNESCTQSDLVKSLLLSKSAASRRVNKLIEMELVVRRKRDDDNRWEELSLTSTGNQVYKHFLSHRKFFLDLLIHDLSQEEIILFRSVLQNFQNTISPKPRKKKENSKKN